MHVPESGEISVKGTAGATPARLEATLDIRKVPLVPLQPYLDAVARVELVSGVFSADGTFQYGTKADTPDIRFAGDVTVQAFEIRDVKIKERLVAWNALSLEGIRVETAPGRLRIDQLTARSPYARIAIAEDRTVNITDVFLTQQSTKEKGTAGSQKSGKVMPVEIGLVRIEKGSTHFSDLSLIPHVAAGIFQLDGQMKGFSSKPQARASVDLAGKVFPYGSVAVAGQLNPLSADAYTNLKVQFTTVPLTTLSPYSGKFAGYVIKDGTLSLDINYKVSARRLVSENKIVLNQLTLGERTDSPDAVRLPIALAVALLKDAKGVIDIDLPVRGNLDDPEFSYGRIVWKALVNLLTKIVASPFHLLGSLVGGDEETMKYVAFSPGSSIMNEPEQQKVMRLSQALAQRPALRLELRGVFHKEVDGHAIREARFEERFSQRLAASGRATNKEELKILEAMVKDQFGKEELRTLRTRFEQAAAEKDRVKESGASEPVEGVAASSGVDQGDYRTALRSRLVQAEPLSEAELTQLGSARAPAVKDALVQKGNLPADRILVGEPEAVDQVVDDLIRARLNLTGG
jgi:hypothetical protein